MKLEQVKCYYCSGTGLTLRRPQKNKYTDRQRQKALKLFKQGMSLRKIGKEIGLKEPVHAQQVQSLIDVYVRRLTKY